LRLPPVGTANPKTAQTKTHHNRQISATKKHAVRVLGRYGINGLSIPTLDFARVTRILDQDLGGANDLTAIFYISIKKYYLEFNTL